MREDTFFTPSAETRILRELCYAYPALLEDPNTALRDSADICDVDLNQADININVEEVSESLRETKRTLEEDEWENIARPWRSNYYIQGEEINGTVDKVLRIQEGYVPTLVKTGVPPKNGVWSSDRVEATAVARLVEGGFGESVSRIFVEYPRKGEIREVRVNERDRRELKLLLKKLNEAREGHPPSRIKNRNKCKRCDFREECGVKTESLFTRLRSRLSRT